MLNSKKIITYIVGWSHSMRLYNETKPRISSYIYHYLNPNIAQAHEKKLFFAKGLQYKIFLLRTRNTTFKHYALIKIFDINEVSNGKLALYKILDDKE